MPLCRALGRGLHELRVSLSNRREARLLFCIHDETIVALHAFVKKTRATPQVELELAEQRRRWNMSKNPHLGSTLEEFLEAEGKLEEATEYAVKAVIAWQLAEAMKEGGLSKTAMAARLRTSRTQINRILDPANGEVSIATLRKAAEAVGRKLKIELYDAGSGPSCGVSQSNSDSCAIGTRLLINQNRSRPNGFGRVPQALNSGKKRLVIRSP